jgi:hypothetical protein
MSLWPFLRILQDQFNDQNYRLLLEGALKELREPRLKLYVKL